MSSGASSRASWSQTARTDAVEQRPRPCHHVGLACGIMMPAAAGCTGTLHVQVAEQATEQQSARPWQVGYGCRNAAGRQASPPGAPPGYWLPGNSCQPLDWLYCVSAALNDRSCARARLAVQHTCSAWWLIACADHSAACQVLLLYICGCQSYNIN